MDTSETYIKQCEKAVEIQESWQALKHDLYVYREDDLKFHIHMVRQDYIPQYLTKYPVYVWLPRQDQLQEMSGQLPTETWLVLKLVQWATEYSDHYKDTIYTQYARQFTSMEQLWLAFVMFDKYNKVWDEESWLMVKDSVGAK